MQVLLAVFWVLVTVGVLAGIWGIGIERHLRLVRQEEQTLAVLPGGAKPIRVLHISDFHLAPWQKRKLAWISRLAKQDIDLVIDTGDNLGHRNAIAPTLTALKGLLQKPGAFVNGSNDYYAPQLRNPLRYLLAPSERGTNVQLNTKEFTDGLESGGWLNLNNRGGNLTVNGTQLAFVGVDDFHDGLADLSSIERSKHAMSDPRAEAESFRSSGTESGEHQVLIGVSHAPYLAVIDAMNDAGASVLFAGHTHGGQVCLPGFGALVTNCDLPTRAAKGLSSWSRGGNQLWLNVCAGLGHSIYAPVRFACRPEVRIVTLVARD
jgi:predicted MPP superfamily phosphohydrolase